MKGPGQPQQKRAPFRGFNLKIEKDVSTTDIVESEVEQTTISTNRTAPAIIVLIALCTCAFIFCFLVSVGVLHYINQLENLLPPYVPYGNQLTILGLKVLHKLGLTTQSTFQLAGSNIRIYHHYRKRICYLCSCCIACGTPIQRTGTAPLNALYLARCDRCRMHITGHSRPHIT